MHDKVDVTLWVDALQPQLSGIGRYCWELCQALPGHPGVTSTRFFAGDALLENPSSLLAAGQTRVRRGPLQKLLRPFQRRTIAKTLFHGPNYFLPDFVEQGVITVHDLSVFKYPETHPIERIKHFEKYLGSSVSRAAHIITDTDVIRREVIDTFGVSAANVTAVPLGVDASFRPRSAADLVQPLARYGLDPQSYGLSVSTLEPRKKILELIAAWRRLPLPLRSRYPLVLAGGAGWRNDTIRTAIEQGKAEGWLKHLGFVSEAELPTLYAGAALFVYPSIYEGFGLPPLEAMASGVPVIISGSACLSEVCGSVALVCDPDEPDSFLELIVRGLEDMQWRAGAVPQGLARAATFGWARTIDGTVDVYRIARTR